MPRMWNEKGERAYHFEHGLIARSENKQALPGAAGRASNKPRSLKGPRGRTRDEQAVRR